MGQLSLRHNTAPPGPSSLCTSMLALSQLLGDNDRPKLSQHWSEWNRLSWLQLPHKVRLKLVCTPFKALYGLHKFLLYLQQRNFSPAPSHQAFNPLICLNADIFNLYLPLFPPKAISLLTFLSSSKTWLKCHQSQTFATFPGDITFFSPRALGQCHIHSHSSRNWALPGPGIWLSLWDKALSPQGEPEFLEFRSISPAWLGAS